VRPLLDDFDAALRRHDDIRNQDSRWWSMATYETLWLIYGKIELYDRLAGARGGSGCRVRRPTAG
jgi:hypothetical protein